MAYKPVGIDEDGNLPPRADIALMAKFVTLPKNITDGQVPVWDANSNTWVGGSSAAHQHTATDIINIDGGIP